MISGFANSRPSIGTSGGLPPVVVMPHIPRTGGTSLRLHAKTHLKPDGALVDLSAKTIREEEASGATPWHLRPKQERQNARFIIGHRVFEKDIKSGLAGRQIHYVTCLRDPAARWVSNYNFNIGRGWIESGTDFFSFYEKNKNRNSLCLFLWNQFYEKPPASNDAMLAFLIEELETFALVGVQEHYDYFARSICEFLGMPPLSKRYSASGDKHPITQMVTDDIRKRVLLDCEADYVLYNHFAQKSVEQGAN